MFKNKTSQGRNNICGRNIYKFRTSGTEKLSQRMVAEKMQLHGIDIDKNAIQRMESGQRFVTDIELRVLCEIFDVTYDEMMSSDHEDPFN